ARNALAPATGTLHRACPQHHHHRKTHRPPHPHPQQKKRASRAVAVQEPHSEREHHNQCNHPTQKGVLPPTSTPHTHAHTHPKRSMSDRGISTSQLHTLLRSHTWPITPINYTTPLRTQLCAANPISEQASRLYSFTRQPSRPSPTS